VKTVVYDKTGTLTTGDMKLEKVFVKDGGEPVELLQTLYLCEYTSSHPFSRAIKSAFDGDYDSKKVNAYSEYPGKGVLLEYGGDRLIAGSEAFLREFGFVDLIRPDALSLVHAAKNDYYLGCVTFSDELKPGIKDALSSLRKQGVNSNVMLSGDRQAKAEKVSRELGLDHFYAELLPGQKLAKLEEIIHSAEGKVAFVGDGMNDAPSLARADVGIAMGGIGNQASVETADVVLLNDKPGQLSGLFRIARATGAVVRQNIAIVLGVKVLVMVLGVGGISGLWEAIIADVGVTLLVIFNSLRMLRSQRGA
ncbi:MAG: HAD-IC family P-type ATPase, partial [Candidatus Syntrophosphaera sp.]|nr:HAD-IC family P-type ATPase [Candidatus Syntrophosphaera sp.]